ncbi:MAG TPA: protein TolR [Devosia sp.]|nr:protein TolR [Devosia sp.]
MGMGAAGGGSGGGRGSGRRRGRRRGGVMSEINVTPMVDVMLVLLIIFMVAAPMMTAGVPIDLPKTAANELNSQTQPITVAVTPEGAIFVGEEPVSEGDLVAKVTSLAPNGTEDRIFLRGDTAANYGSVMRVMGLLSGAGFTKIGLITEKAPGTP